MISNEAPEWAAPALSTPMNGTEVGADHEGAPERGGGGEIAGATGAVENSKPRPHPRGVEDGLEVVVRDGREEAVVAGRPLLRAGLLKRAEGLGVDHRGNSLLLARQLALLVRRNYSLEDTLTEVDFRGETRSHDVRDSEAPRLRGRCPPSRTCQDVILVPESQSPRRRVRS